MDIKQKMQEILEAECRAVRSIPVTDEYERAVNLIVHQVKELGGKLVTSGMGKAGQIAMNIATTFASTGIPAVTLHPSEAQHGDLGALAVQLGEDERDYRPCGACSQFVSSIEVYSNHRQ